MKIIDAADAMVSLERMVAAVKGQEVQESNFAKALATFKVLARRNLHRQLLAAASQLTGCDGRATCMRIVDPETGRSFVEKRRVG